ncbi:MAG: preA [Anaerocolumna sp.]|nr:preA [Anaerocolumna sp.]
MSNQLYLKNKLSEEVNSCLLCNDAPCKKACPHSLAVDNVIRSLRFDNFSGAANQLMDNIPCTECSEKNCIKACLKGKINRPVQIDEIINIVSNLPKSTGTEVDLSIDFCDIRCENPFFLSSSVVASNYEMIAKAFDMGWAGVAFKTVGLFVPKEVSPRFDMKKSGQSWPRL